MTTTSRTFFRWACAAFIATSIAGCTGTTSVQSTHPLIAAVAGEGARVYFIRPDPGFRGVMDLPVVISLGETELLKLAKGEYTLLPLASGTFQMKVEGYTVAGTPNTMTQVSTSTEVAFSKGETQYLVIELVPRGGLDGSVFLPVQVPREHALEAARELTPVGLAIDEPLSQR